MPEKAIGKIMAATEPADVAQMAVIECLRQIADNGKKTASVLEGVQTEVRDVRERLIRIEASKFEAEVAEAKAEVVDVRRRVEALEADKNRRDGAMSLFDWLFKNWPGVIGVVALIMVMLLATGRVSL